MALLSTMAPMPSAASFSAALMAWPTSDALALITTLLVLPALVSATVMALPHS